MRRNQVITALGLVRVVVLRLSLRLGWFLCVVVTTAFIFSGSALAQGDASYYFVTYFSNNVSGAPDATVRISNDGDDNYTLYPFFSVFDDSQELQACGYCQISPDGLLSEDVKTELTNNTLTGKIPSRGVITVFEFYQQPGLHGWATHIEATTTTFPAPGPGKAVNAVEKGPFFVTEAPLADSNLSFNEWESLLNLCGYAQTLGSGSGTITCTAEDYDF